MSAGYGDERGEVRERPTFYGAAATPRTAPFGTVTKRFNDFRSAYVQNPCPAG